VVRRGEHEQIPLSIKLTTSLLHNPFFNHLSGSEIHRSRRGKVAVFRKIGPFIDIQSLDGFRNNKIEVGVALPVGMGTQIDRHPVGEEPDIGTVVGIESTQKILIGLACATRVLDCNESRNQTQYLRRAALWLEKNFFVRDELLRGGDDL